MDYVITVILKDEDGYVWEETSLDPLDWVPSEEHWEQIMDNLRRIVGL